MTPLVFEIALRLAKAAAAALVGLAVFLVAMVVGADPTVELAILSWLAGAAFILLVETSPI